MGTRPLVLSIAGFDPSGGAGVLADVKTCEQLGVYGLAACTAITYQTDGEFKGLSWLSLNQIADQLTPLFDRFQIEWIKIGLIKDLSTLADVLDFVKERSPTAKVVWDPIRSASAGFEFHKSFDSKQLQQVLSQIFILTPNKDEIDALVHGKTGEEAALTLSPHCKILLKGGHGSDSEVEDLLFENKDRVSFPHHRLMGVRKHGSGCVFSAALTSLLSNGATLHEACVGAQEYTRFFLVSAQGLLGYHAQATS